jgi:hypothetical protein
VTALWNVSILESPGVAFGLVCLACLFAVLSVSISTIIHHQNYDMPTPVRYSNPLFTFFFFTTDTTRAQYWCWISSHYVGERLGGEYVWLWVGLFASVIFYAPVYFWKEGRLSISEDRWWWPEFHKPNFDGRVEYGQRRAALAMLA